MAKAARPSAQHKWPNPCAAFRPPPPPLAARRPDGTPWLAPPKAKDATPCPAPTSGGDRGHSGQAKRAPDNVMSKPSGGTYIKPDARVKIIPAEDIVTYARHGKTFGRTVSSADMLKRRSITPPPSSRRVLLARSTPPQKTSSLPEKRYGTAGNKQTVSLKRPSPLCKSVQRGAVRPVVLRKESEMNPVTPSSVHVLPAHSSKVTLATEAEPSSRSVSTVDNTKICSPRNQQTNLEASVSCNMSSGAPAVLPAKLYTKPNQSKSTTQAPHVELSNDAEAVPSTKSHIRNVLQRNQEASTSCNMSAGAPAVLPAKLYMKPDGSKSTTQAPHVQLFNDVEAVPSTKSHIRNVRQTNQEASTSCNMFAGAPAVFPTKLYKKPDQSKSLTQVPHVELSDDDVEAVPSTKSHVRNVQQTNQEESTSCNMSAGAQAILHTELYKKPIQPEPTTPGPCVEMSIDLVFPSTKRHMGNEKQTNQEASTSCDMPSAAPLILHTEPCKKTYRPDAACWRGKFEVTGELTHTCNEIEAHFPLEVFIKVYEASKQMPEVLKLEALALPPMLPKKFKMEPPDAQDIGLCFISSHQRPNRNFDHLLEKISSNIGLRTDIGTTELLIFSSKLLTEDDQTMDGNFYFCGVFRKHLRKKSGGKLELTGEKEMNVINKCIPMPKTPDANAASNAAPTVSFFTGSCSPVSAGSSCKAATKVPSCGDLTLYPPPGFTSAHRGLHTNGVSTLSSEKKSTIKFSLNVTRPVQTDDIPPGFSKPTGNVNNKEIKHDKVAVEVDDGSEERQFPKIKRLSDILGFSPASSSNNVGTPSNPRNCPEVCRPAAAVPRASKFQETGPPELQKLCRKRGQPDPSNPATKRLKVNGRIAPIGSMDCRALNSNQAQGNAGKS